MQGQTSSNVSMNLPSSRSKKGTTREPHSLEGSADHSLPTKPTAFQDTEERTKEKERKKKAYLVRRPNPNGETLEAVNISDSTTAFNQKSAIEGNKESPQADEYQDTMGTSLDASHRKKKIMLIRKAKPGEDMMNPNIRVIDPHTLNMSKLPFRDPNEDDILNAPVSLGVTDQTSELSILGNPADFEKILLQRSGLQKTQSLTETSQAVRTKPERKANMDENVFAITKSLASVGRITPSQQDDLTRSLTSLRAARLEETLKEKESLRKMKIFERIDKMKEENSLERFKKAETEWNRIKTRLMRVTGKTEDQLVLSSTAEFRAKKEEAELIERSLPLYYDRGIDSALHPSEFKPIERIGNPKAEKNSSLKSWENSEYLKMRKKQLEKYMRNFAAPEQDVRGLIVEGESLIPVKALEELSKSQNAGETFELSHDLGNISEIVTAETNVEEENIKKEELKPIQLPSNRLCVESIMGTLESASFSITNNRNYVVYYAWEKMTNKSVWKKPVDNKQRFFFADTVGCILPGEKHEFTFSFRSERPGIFFEYWRFHTTPKIEATGTTLIVKGVSLDPEDREPIRKALDAEISSRVVLRSMNVIVYDILDLVKIPEVSHQFEVTVDDLPERFTHLNESFNIEYTPEIHRTYERLANRVSHYNNPLSSEEWNNSVATIIDSIDAVGDSSTKLKYVQEMEDILRQRPQQEHQESPRPSHYTSMYALLASLLDDIHESASNIRKKHNLPPKPFSFSVEDDEEDETARNANKTNELATEDEDPTKKKTKSGKAAPVKKETPAKMPALPIGKEKEKEKEKGKTKDGEKRESRSPDSGSARKPTSKVAKSSTAEELPDEQSMAEQLYLHELQTKVRQLIVRVLDKADDALLPQSDIEAQQEIPEDVLLFEKGELPREAAVFIDPAGAEKDQKNAHKRGNRRKK